jgi:hypothetical protein
LERIVALSPLLFGVHAAAYEIVIGLLLLGKGQPVRWGIIGGVAHLLIITPLGVWTLANPMLALALVTLLRHEYDRSLPELLTDATRRRRGPRPVSQAAGQR